MLDEVEVGVVVGEVVERRQCREGRAVLVSSGARAQIERERVAVAVDESRAQIQRLRARIVVMHFKPQHGHAPEACLCTGEFERLRDSDALLEWAEVHGNFYGTPREPVAQFTTWLD